MSELRQDFRGKSFNVEKSDTGLEIWTSEEDPKLVFEEIDTTKDFVYRDGGRCVSVENIADLMPVTDKMFFAYKDGNAVGREYGNKGKFEIRTICNASTFSNSQYNTQVTAGLSNSVSYGFGPSRIAVMDYYLSPGMAVEDKGDILFTSEKEISETKTVPELLSVIENMDNWGVDLQATPAGNKIMEHFHELVDNDNYAAYKKDIVQCIVKHGFHSYKDSLSLWLKMAKDNPDIVDNEIVINDAKDRYSYYGRYDNKIIVSTIEGLGSYSHFLSDAAYLATDQDNRRELLQKMFGYAKAHPSFSPTTSLFSIAKEDDTSVPLILDILRTSTCGKKSYAIGEDNYVELMMEKPQLVSQILPILASQLENTSCSGDVSSFCADTLKENKNEIFKYPSLIKLLDVNESRFEKYAQVYEEYAVKKSENMASLTPEDQKIMENIKNLLISSEGADYSFIKHAKEFPNLINDAVSSIPWAEKCLKYFENPEKENIRSLLNRLQATDAQTDEEFFAAVDFVHRLDMCRNVCRKYDKEHNCSTNRSQMGYALAEIGVETPKVAERIVDLFYKLNKRPETYGSDYNQYYPRQLLPVAKMQELEDWMYPVVISAVENGGFQISATRTPSEKTLFDCCKAWKICPQMPQRLAESVGKQGLYNRMLAGAIFDKMSADGNTSSEEWRENKQLHEQFLQELARAEKMPKDKALKQYLPNTPINRKRFVGAFLEANGVESNLTNFKETYNKMREKGTFENVFAKVGEEHTTFSSRLMVKLARNKYQY